MWRRRCGAKRRFGVRTGVAASASKRRTLRVRSIRICLSCLFTLLSIALEDETLGQRASRIVEFANRASLAGRPACVSRNRGEPVWRRVSFLLTLSPAYLPLSLSLSHSLPLSFSPLLSHSDSLTRSLGRFLSRFRAGSFTPLFLARRDAFCFFSLAHSFAFFPFSHTHAYIYIYTLCVHVVPFVLSAVRSFTLFLCLLTFSSHIPSSSLATVWTASFPRYTRSFRSPLSLNTPPSRDFVSPTRARLTPRMSSVRSLTRDDEKRGARLCENESTSKIVPPFTIGYRHHLVKSLRATYDRDRPATL